MTWMTDAEVFYRQLDKDISTEVARREIVTKPFNGQTLYKLEVSAFPRLLRPNIDHPRI